jgi:hypothetical protein
VILTAADQTSFDFEKSAWIKESPAQAARV